MTPLLPPARGGLCACAGLAALLLSACAAAPTASPLSAPPAAEAGLQAVAALARVNGEALACQDPVSAQRAKSLMLVHAPKTARYGEAFDDGTRDAFLARTRSTTECPAIADRQARLDALEPVLRAALPLPGRQP